MVFVLNTYKKKYRSGNAASLRLQNFGDKSIFKYGIQRKSFSRLNKLFLVVFNIVNEKYKEKKLNKYVKKDFWFYYMFVINNKKSNPVYLFRKYLGQPSNKEHKVRGYYKPRLNINTEFKNSKELNTFLLNVNIRRDNAQGKLYYNKLKTQLSGKLLTKNLRTLFKHSIIFVLIIGFMFHFRLLYVVVECFRPGSPCNIEFVVNFNFKSILWFSFIYITLIGATVGIVCSVIFEMYQIIHRQIFYDYDVVWTLSSDRYLDWLQRDINSIKKLIIKVERLENIYIYYTSIKWMDIFYTGEHAKCLLELTILLKNLEATMKYAHVLLEQIKKCEGYLYLNANIILSDCEILKRDAKWIRESSLYNSKINFYFSTKMKDEILELHCLDEELENICLTHKKKYNISLLRFYILFYYVYYIPFYLQELNLWYSNEFNKNLVKIYVEIRLKLII